MSSRPVCNFCPPATAAVLPDTRQAHPSAIDLSVDTLVSGAVVMRIFATKPDGTLASESWMLDICPACYVTLRNAVQTPA